MSHPCFLSIVSLGLKEAITILGSCHDLQQMLQFAVMIVLFSSQWVLGVIDLGFRKVRKVCKDCVRTIAEARSCMIGLFIQTNIV